MSLTNEKYIVLDVPGVSGLLVSDYVYKPGRIFNRNEWKWGDDVLLNAIRSKRCKLVEEIKVESAKKAIAENDKSDKQKKLEALYEKYSTLDSKSKQAIELEDKIKKLEAEIAEDDAE